MSFCARWHVSALVPRDRFVDTMPVGRGDEPLLARARELGPRLGPA